MVGKVNNIDKIRLKIFFYKALKIAFVVGTVLNFINQGTFLENQDWTQFSSIKFFLNYLTPFFVSFYTGMTFKREKSPGMKVDKEGELECIQCKKKIKVKKGDLIPDCPNCGTETFYILHGSQYQLF